MNGSPLFAGGAASGESEIRRWMLENDWIEAIVALPTDLFYNTGISTFVWLLNNRKPSARRGKVQLIDASSERFWKSMRKSLGSKRREIPESARHEIVRIYAEILIEGGSYSEFSKIFETTAFGYREVRVERPLRLSFQVTLERLKALRLEKPFLKLELAEQDDLIICLKSHMPRTVFKNRDAFEKAIGKALKSAGVKISAPVKKAMLSIFAERNEEADICLNGDGHPEPDTELRDFEFVPLKESWSDYLAREVTPFVPDAWVDETYCDDRDGEIGRVGYEINFNRYFYKYVPPRPIEAIDAELKQIESEIASLLNEVAA